MEVTDFKKKKNETEIKMSTLQKYQNQIEEFNKFIRAFQILQDDKYKVLQRHKNIVNVIYGENTQYYEHAQNIKKAFQREEEETLAKKNFLDSIPNFVDEKKKNIQSSLKMKNQIFKCLRNEFQQLKKIKDLESYQETLIKRNSSVIKVQEKIKRNKEKYKKMKKISDSTLQKFNIQFKEILKKRFDPINKILYQFLQKFGLYFSTMNNIYNRLDKKNSILMEKPDKYSLNLNLEARRPSTIEQHNKIDISGLSRYTENFDLLPNSKQSKVYSSKITKQQKTNEKNTKEKDNIFFTKDIPLMKNSAVYSIQNERSSQNIFNYRDLMKKMNDNSQKNNQMQIQYQNKTQTHNIFESNDIQDRKLELKQLFNSNLNKHRKISSQYLNTQSKNTMTRNQSSNTFKDYFYNQII